MAFFHWLKSRQAKVAASLFLLGLPLTFSAGCGLLTPPPPVAGSPEQALKDGETREEDARVAEKNGDKSEATDRWQKTATYYGAVASKFVGTETGLKASLEQAQALDKGTNNKQQAQQLMYKVLRQYQAGTFPQVYQEAQTYYDDLLSRIIAENSQTFPYKVMDTLVKIFGNNPRVSPVLAVFAVAVLVTVLVWPFRVQQYRSMREMQRWMPELQRIQEKHKNDQQAALVAQQAFYKEHGINQFAGCLPMLLQLPITYFMYMVILNYQFNFAQAHFLWINPQTASASSSWPWPFTNMFGHHLGEQDLLMLIVYAGSMYLTTKFMPQTPSTDPQVIEQQRMMTIMMPTMFFIMMLQWQPASAFVLYWFVSNVLSLGQQWIIYKTLPPVTPVILPADGGATPSSGNPPLKPNPKLVSPKNKKK